MIEVPHQARYQQPTPVITADDQLLKSGSYVAPLAALGTIIAACAALHPKRTLDVLHEYEKEYTNGTRWYQEPQGERANDH